MAAVLLRAAASGPDEDPYHKELLANGYTPESVPVLAFQFTNQNELSEILRNPGGYGGLILTSQRAVDALQKVISQLVSETTWKETLQEKWNQNPVFVVGNATAKAARDQLGLAGLGHEAGGAESLVPHILEVVSPGGKPLFFPCGNLRRETIPQEMANAGIQLTSLHVYVTCEDPNFRHSLRDILTRQKSRTPLFVVFFSPSGVEFAAKATEGMEQEWSDVQLVAIGNTSAKAMTQRGWCVAAVAEQPNPRSLVQRILAYSRQKSGDCAAEPEVKSPFDATPGEA